MKKHLLILATAFVALSLAFASCEKENNPGDNPGDTTDITDDPNNPDQPTNSLIGVYDLDMVYDSITTSDGTWFDEEFFEMMTGKVNPPEHGYLTIAEGENGKLNVTATFIKDDTKSEKVWFTTTATETDGILTLDPCSSDYFITTEQMINFTFHNFQNNLPTITFKSIYTINLGADYSYLTAYTCTKR